MNPTFIDDMSWRMAEVYGAVVDRILVNLASHFKMISEGKPVPGSWNYQVKKLAELGQVTQETKEIILKSLDGADEAMQALLEESIREGLKDAEPAMKKAAERGLTTGNGFLPPEVEPRQMQAFRAYYEQSADRLNLVNTVMLDSTEKAYRETVSDIVARIEKTQGILNTETGEVVSGVAAFNKAVREGVQRMADNGLTGFIDHGGHHWSPEAYVAMDIRSTMANTAREAVWERSEEYGCDLYQVSHHDGARPLCYPWQGKVISKSGWTGEVKDGEGNTVHVYAETETSYGKAAGLFGVNCKHYPIPFFPEFSRIRPPDQNKEENDKEYAESQQQRKLERNLRNEKRDLEVLKAQDAPEADIKAQRQKVAEARGDLDEFCRETGRARRSGREYTPINASWAGALSGSETELLHKQATHQRISPEGRKIIPEPLYKKLTNPVIKAGGDIERGTEFAERHLRNQGAYASHIAGKIFLRQDATISDVIEEVHHFYQERSGKYSKYDEPEYTLRMEIDAKKRLLSLAERYKIPAEETRLTQTELQTYERWLEEWLATH